MKLRVLTLVRYGMMFLLIVTFLSCRTRSRRYIIPQKKFVSVLVDIHLADGMAMENMRFSDPFVLDSASLYQSVFHKHHVTRAMFDSTLQYYTARPDEFQKIYNILTARLKHKENELNAAQDTTTKEKVIR